MSIVMLSPGEIKKDNSLKKNSLSIFQFHSISFFHFNNTRIWVLLRVIFIEFYGIATSKIH